MAQWVLRVSMQQFPFIRLISLLNMSKIEYENKDVCAMSHQSKHIKKVFFINFKT